MFRILVLFIFIPFLVGCGPIKYMKGDTFRTKIWMDGKNNYYKKGVELEGGEVLFEVLPEKQHVFTHGGLSVKKNNKGRFKVTEVHSKEDLSQWREQIKINSEKKEKEKEESRVAKLKKIQNGRSYLGLFFGMTLKDVQHVKNEKLVCEPIQFEKRKKFGPMTQYMSDMKDFNDWIVYPNNTIGPTWGRNFGNKCTRVGYEGLEGNISMFFDYKESPSLEGVRFKKSGLSELSTLVKKLKKKYKFIAGPGIGESIKRLADGNSVTYWFENNISPKRPKYISLNTEDGLDIVMGEWVMIPNRDVMISYYSEERGLALVSKILAEKESERVKKQNRRKAKLSADDDL